MKITIDSKLFHKLKDIVDVVDNSHPQPMSEDMLEDCSDIAGLLEEISYRAKQVHDLGGSEIDLSEIRPPENEHPQESRKRTSTAPKVAQLDKQEVSLVKEIFQHTALLFHIRITSLQDNNARKGLENILGMMNRLMMRDPFRTSKGLRDFPGLPDLDNKLRDKGEQNYE